MGHTWKKGGHNWKIGYITLGKMSHTEKNGSHLEKRVKRLNMGHTLKKMGHLW